MKNLLCGFLALLPVVFFSCSSGTFSNDSLDSAREANDSALDEKGAGQGIDMAIADFAVNAANAGMLEMAMGDIARQRAVSERVRRFSGVIASYHTKANEELKETALSQGIALPSGLSNDGKKTMERISKKNGREFDKAFMEIIARDYKEDISAFKKISATCRNPIIKRYAARSLPVLQKHLDTARALGMLYR